METEDDSDGRASTGISGLDAILGGGFLKHHVYLIQGSASGIAIGPQLTQFRGLLTGTPVMGVGPAESSRPGEGR
jgi:predicted ATP-dependent serine protease